MRRSSRSERIVILGKSGSGKSSLAKALARSASRVLVFDPIGEYRAPVRIHDDPQRLYAFLCGSRAFQVAYVPGEPLDRQFNLVCRMAYVTGHMTFIADELGQFCYANWTGPGFSKLLRQGRHNGVTTISIAQRAADIPKTATANMSRLFAFNSSEPGDLAYYRSRLGADAMRIPNLPIFPPTSTGIEWNDRGEKRLVDVDPVRQTFRFRPMGSHQAPAIADLA